MQRQGFPLYCDVPEASRSVDKMEFNLWLLKKNGGEQVLFPVNDDEPIAGKIEEFNASGKLFKELYYIGFYKVYKKVTDGRNGHKTVQESLNGPA